MSESPEDPCTLYVRGLNNDRVKRSQLLRNLHMFFSRYGKVTRIRAGVGVKGKGQAWITFSARRVGHRGLEEAGSARVRPSYYHCIC